MILLDIFLISNNSPLKIMMVYQGKLTSLNPHGYALSVMIHSVSVMILKLAFLVQLLALANSVTWLEMIHVSNHLAAVAHKICLLMFLQEIVYKAAMIPTNILMSKMEFYTVETMVKIMQELTHQFMNGKMDRN